MCSEKFKKNENKPHDRLDDILLTDCMNFDDFGFYEIIVSNIVILFSFNFLIIHSNILKLVVNWY